MIWRNIPNINIPMNEAEYKLFIVADYGAGKWEHKEGMSAVTEIETFLKRMVEKRTTEGFEHQCNFNSSAELDGTSWWRRTLAIH